MGWEAAEHRNPPYRVPAARRLRAHPARHGTRSGDCYRWHMKMKNLLKSLAAATAVPMLACNSFHAITVRGNSGDPRGKQCAVTNVSRLAVGGHAVTYYVETRVVRVIHFNSNDKAFVRFEYDADGALTNIWEDLKECPQ